jgi:hypothetical protein
LRLTAHPCWRPLALVATVAWLGVGPVAGQSNVPTLYAFDEVVAGNEELRLRWPTAVAAGGGAEIAVVDAAGPSLIVFRDQGGAAGWVVHTALDLPAPAYSLSSDGNEYLLSTRQPGTLLAVGKSDYALRQVPIPADITPGAAIRTADGQLLVHDLAAGRLVVLDGALEVRATIALQEAVAALVAGSGGGFYATLPGTGEIRRYGANGELLSAFPVPGVDPVPAWPVGLVVEANGEMIVVDRHGGRLLVLEASGRLAGSGSRKGWEPGLLRFPAGLARLPDGRIVVADQGNGRVQFFRRVDP